MNYLRPLSFLVAAAALATLPACASESTEAAASTADQLGLSLKGQVILKGSVAQGAALRVAYQPELYEESTTLPYLGIAILPTTGAPRETAGLRTRNGAAQQLAIDVAGDFPGTPQVIVVDSAFHVIAETTGEKFEGGAHAAITIASDEDPAFVLVRDELWVRPMEFELVVGV